MKLKLCMFLLGDRGSESIRPFIAFLSLDCLMEKYVLDFNINKKGVCIFVTITFLNEDQALHIFTYLTTMAVKISVHMLPFIRPLFEIRKWQLYFF